MNAPAKISDLRAEAETATAETIALLDSEPIRQQFIDNYMIIAGAFRRSRRRMVFDAATELAPVERVARGVVA